MEQKYTLPRDAAETERLIEQHRVLVSNLGCLIHPAIPINKPGLRIADMATGTAIWLLDLAKELPADCELHGFDISTDQYPDVEHCPKNLFLHQQDIINPFPAKYTGFFDIVAVRLVTLGLRGNDWDNAVKNISMLLKPGGYIQWLDPDHTKIRIFNNRAGAPSEATQEVAGYMVSVMKKIMYPGPLRLPQMYAENGLETISLEIFATDRRPEDRYWHTVGLIETGGPQMMNFLVKDESHALTAERAAALMARVKEETKSEDIYIHSELYFVIGRKPED